MQVKTAPKIHPAPPPAASEEVEPSPSPVRIPRSLIVSMALNGLMVVAAVGMAWSTVRLHQRVQVAQQQVTLQANQFATEMEQLRIDVVTTSSENITYLKVMLLKPGIDKQLARDIAHSVVLRSREHKRDPDMTLALIAIESNFNPNAVSSTGAMGLMQVMSFWKATLGIERDLRDIDTNIKAGLDILATYEQTFGGIEMALTAYNRGPSPVIADIKAGRNPFNGYSEAAVRSYSRIKSWTRP
jgi:soluble lytic murein transglycosylase-like protein